jgi:hypothetical protein
MADQHTIEIQLHANMVEINAALDGHHRIKFLLLARRRRDLHSKLSRVVRDVVQPRMG